LKRNEALKEETEKRIMKAQIRRAYINNKKQEDAKYTLLRKEVRTKMLKVLMAALENQSKLDSVIINWILLAYSIRCLTSMFRVVKHVRKTQFQGILGLIRMRALLIHRFMPLYKDKHFSKFEDRRLRDSSQ